MDNNIYLYIPRDIVLNYKSRKHRGDNFRTIYYYKNKRRFKFNEKEINEIDIYHIKDIQKDTLYKSTFKSQKDKYFDWYYCLKEKYNDCESIYINNEKSYTHSKNKEYIRNRKDKQTEHIKEHQPTYKSHNNYIITFD
tara:strand:- start:504 stop:917 length:414 start_codon:yes stop_codon:yes gene_type:complete